MEIAVTFDQVDRPIYHRSTGGPAYYRSTGGPAYHRSTGGPAYTGPQVGRPIIGPQVSMYLVHLWAPLPFRPPASGSRGTPGIRPLGSWLWCTCSTSRPAPSTCSFQSSPARSRPDPHPRSHHRSQPEAVNHSPVSPNISLFLKEEFGQLVVIMLVIKYILVYSEQSRNFQGAGLKVQCFDI